MIIYKVDTTISEDRNSYGLKIYKNEKIIDYFPDITPNKADITKIADMCNQLKIQPCHIGDIIEDYLTDFKI